MAENADAKARIFPVETHFQKVARRPGGVPREQAIESARAEIELIKPGFDDWLDKVLQDLIANAHGGDAKPDWLEAANFHCRQLRDSGTTMGFELLSFIAGSLCELLDSIAAGGECNMRSIVCHTDALILARQVSHRHLKPEQVPELIKGLRQVTRRIRM